MSKQAGLSVAIGFVGVGIILHALPKLGVGPAASAASPAPVAAAAAGGTGPTIVWYGSDGNSVIRTLWRAWSDGTVEVKKIRVSGSEANWCDEPVLCSSPWLLVSSPSAGLSAAVDSNFDQVVDGADLTNLLAAWGPAPRSPIPPSDCPLDLINP